MKLRALTLPLVIAIFLTALTYFSLWPGSRYLFDGRTDVALSDGSDPAAAPYMHWTLQKLWEENPKAYLYGALVSDRWNPPEGHAIWASFYERFLTLSGLGFNIEQVNTWHSFASILLNLLVMFLLGRKLGWSRELSVAGSIAYGLCSYAKARAKVHSALAGIYFLPMTLLGFVYLRDQKDRYSLQKAMLCFLLAAASPFYYVILLAVISPFFLWFYFQSASVASDKITGLKRLAMAALPAVLFLAMTLLNPIPSGSTVETVFPATGVAEEWPHPFMQKFAASPIDYLTGDISWGLTDWNPLRAELSSAALTDANQTSNAHERTNGIRWSVLFVLGLALWWLWKEKKSKTEGKEIAIFTCMGIAGFLISLPPKWGGLLIGPSALVHLAVSQFRVPSRAGVIVLFAAVLITGMFITLLPKLGGFARLKRLIAVPGLMIFIVLMDLPPLMNKSPLAPILPVQRTLQALGETCGYGIYFPYVSNTYGLNEYYYFLQTLRSTECRPMNGATMTRRDQFFLGQFALVPDLIKLIQNNDAGLKQRLAKTVTCSGMSWIVFDPRMPPEWKRGFCASINWKMADDQVCLSPTPSSSLRALPETCGG